MLILWIARNFRTKDALVDFHCFAFSLIAQTNFCVSNDLSGFQKLEDSKLCAHLVHS